MEQKDDFESLLKGMAARYDEALYSEKPVSEIIETRMAAGKAKLLQSLKKEIIIIVVAVFFTLLVFLPGFSYPFFAPERIGVMKAICALSLVYFIAGIILYVWLIRLSFSQKGMDMRQYISLLYKRTKFALKVYLWLSTIVNAGLIPLMLLLLYKVSYAWIPIIGVSGVLIYYSNVWYIKKRFGEGLQELETLITEFNQ